MHTPAAALAWELWRRHRLRLIAIIGLVLGFALIYPLLCAAAGFNPAGLDPLDQIAKIVSGLSYDGPRTFACLKILFSLFLVCGPWLAMIVTLLCVTWMFTLIELDPKTKVLTFPGRLFTLPVSTPFLSWSLVLAGMVSIFLLHGCWFYLVRMPHLEMFGTYQSCLGWMTLLALAQGLVWALDGWPKTRVVLVAAVFFCFLFSPVQRQLFQSPWVLPPLFLLGVALARVGMQKVRHGQWQGWAAWLPWVTGRARPALKGPRRFASPAQAQMWFEWRRLTRPLCLGVAVLTFAPVAIFLGLRLVLGRPMQTEDLTAFLCCLLGVPLLVHFTFAISPLKTDLPFLMDLPLTNGEMMMPKLKAAALSSVISWGCFLAALCCLPLLGDFSGVWRSASVWPEGYVVMAVGLIFLTWRFIPVNLGFVLSGNRRLAAMPVWLLLAMYLGGIILAVLARDETLWIEFWYLLPLLLAGLVALKFLLAFMAFGFSLERRLLSPSAVVGYLLVWCAIVAVLLMLLAAMVWKFPPDRAVILPMALGIVLLVPLARIGFCPIALAWNRHA